MQIGQQLGQRLQVAQRRHLVEGRLDRLPALLVGGRVIHAGAVEIGQALAAGLGLGHHLLQRGAQDLLIVLVQHREAAPARLVRRDRMRLGPGAAGILVEIGAGVDRRIDLRQPGGRFAGERRRHGQRGAQQRAGEDAFLHRFLFGYQMRQALSPRTMGSVALQWKALAKASLLESVPLTR